MLQRNPPSLAAKDSPRSGGEMPSFQKNQSDTIINSFVSSMGWKVSIEEWTKKAKVAAKNEKKKKKEKRIEEGRTRNIEGVHPPAPGA